MAILQSTQTQYGVEATYWRVNYISLDKHNKYGSISLNLYFEKDAEQYIDSHTVFIETPEIYEEYFGTEAQAKYRDIYHSAYEFIKTHTEKFIDGVPDEEELLR